VRSPSTRGARLCVRQGVHVEVWAQIKAWCVPVVCEFFVGGIFSAVIGHIGYDFPQRA
jgi:hypothetical protein